MKLSYYPGCTLKTQAKELEASALASLHELGIEATELKRWNCCGVVYSLADDNLMNQLAPLRVLIRAQEEGSSHLLTLCSMCYNTLARTNLLVKEQPDKLNTLNLFMDEEPDYRGEVEVVHLLSLLDQEIGWTAIASRVRRPLSGLKVAPYYGCKLQRPRPVGIEPPGRFRLLSKLISALGAQIVDNPAADLCCGSYQAVADPPLARELSRRVLEKSAWAGAETLAVSCPLCFHNLSQARQALASETGAGTLPEVVYFTQLMSQAFKAGASADVSESAETCQEAERDGISDSY